MGITDVTPHPYPAYKPSGVDWLGAVPEHWEVVRLSSVSRPRSVVNQQHRELLSVYLNLGVISFSDIDAKRTNPTSQDLSNYQAVEPGDFVLNNQQAWRGSVGVSNLEGIVSPAYLVLALSSRLDREFADLLFRDKSMVGQYVICSKGVGTIQRNLYWPHLKEIRTLIPPLPEQAAIVRYLDHADRRIRRYVSAKRKLIALLEEEKQAVINRAVTRGLDPNVRLKPSGVEWLGDVPEHWGQRRLKTILQRIDRRSTTGSETLLSLRRDHGVVVYAEHFARPSQSRSLVGFKLVSSGQLVVNRLQANNGLVFNSTLDGLVSPDYSVFEKKSSLHMQFLSDLLRISSYRAYFRQNSTGLGTGTAGFLRLYDDTFLDTPVYLPPLSEQAAITEHLDKAAAGADAAITRARRQIELVQEYRTRLIADVVTGKLDVRGAAAQLPDEGDDRDSTEEDGLLADGMEGDLSDADASVEESVIESEVAV